MINLKKLFFLKFKGFIPLEINKSLSNNNGNTSAGRIKRGRFLSLTGFTYIELLLGLLIFSIIATSIYATFHTSTLVFRRAEDSLRLYQEARFILDKMTKELGRVVPYDFSKNYPNIKSFEGTSDKLSFLIATPMGLKRVSFYLNTPEDSLIRKTILGYRGALPSRITARYEEISSQLMSLERKEESFVESVQTETSEFGQKQIFSYLVKQGGLTFSYPYISSEETQTQTITWKDSWQEENLIPGGLKITLTLVNPNNPKEEKTFTKVVFIPTGSYPEAK